MLRPILFYTDHYDIPLPEGHKFPMSKYRMLRETLSRTDKFEFVPAPFAARETIELAHHPDYVKSFLDGTLSPQAMRRIGFPWSRYLVDRTLASAGGTLAAAGVALENGWGGTLAGGTHHAFRSEGSGFCVFNDIAIAILFLRAEGRVFRAAVIDLDVHQGDGTAAIFEGDPQALTISVHGRNNFPFRKRRSVIDVELDDGTRDDEYLSRVEGVLLEAARFRPEIVFYQSGVDGLKEDRLGRLALTHEGLKRRDELVLNACQNGKLPVVVTLGGGYASPIENTVAAHANTFLTAARIFAAN